MTIVDVDTQVAALRLLAKGYPAAKVADQVAADAGDIAALARKFGWPDRDRLAWAADELDGVPTYARTSADPPSGRPRPPGLDRESPTPKVWSVPVPVVRVLARSPAVIDVVARATKLAPDHPKIAAALTRATTALARLTDLVDATQAKALADAASAAEQSKARTEIARLERELKAQRALLGGGAGRARTSPAAVTSSTADAETPAHVVRAWAREHDVACPAAGRVPRAVRAAYAAAHDPKPD